MNTEEYLKKIYVMLIAVLVISVMSLLIGLVNYSNTSATTNDNAGKTETTTTNDYDVSMFNEVSISDILKFLGTKNSETHVLFLGRSSCSACVAFLPSLRSAQSELKITADYLDITKVDTDSSDFTKFTGYLSKTITQSVNGQEQTGKISEFYGLTPLVIVIKNGEAVDAIIGAYSKDNLLTFLKKYVD